MLLAIDVGNTNIVFALFDHDRIVKPHIIKPHIIKQWRSATDPRRTADDWAVWFFELLRMQGVEGQSITATVMASVVPSLEYPLKTMIKQCLSHDVVMVETAGFDGLLTVEVDRPHEVGADRLINALAVCQDYSCPAIVIDFGTATTFDIIGDQKNYMGGVIAPGPKLSLHALELAAAKLPHVSLARPSKVIGKNTVDAMQSGIYWGYVGLIEGILTRLKDELQIKSPTMIATGGMAGFFAPHIAMFEHMDPDLTLRGLYYYYINNYKNADND